MSDNEEPNWIWDEWGSKEELFQEFLKGPDGWSKTFKYWVLRHIADRLVDSWLEAHDDTDLLREAAEFMECHAMDEKGDPDADEMIDQAITRQRAARKINDQR
jgi:hypothetical protein